MATQSGFPNVKIDIQDNSPQAAAAPLPLPLHVPIFFLYAAQGPVNTPVLDTFAGHQVTFGTETFDERGAFFQHPTVFAKEAGQFQQLIIVRLQDPTAETASMVLSVATKPQAITQFQRDPSTNAILKDGSGNPIPKTQSDGTTIVTEPGVVLSYTIREMAEGETLTSIATTTAVAGGVTVTTYPLMALQGTSPGSMANLSGAKLYYTPSFDAAVVNNIGTMTYRFVPSTLNSALNIANPITDIFAAAFNDISFKANAQDPTTDEFYDINDVVRSNYTDQSTGDSLLPYNINVFSANAKTVADLALSLSPELNDDGVVNGNSWMINILSAIDQAGSPYSHLQVDTASAQVVNQVIVNYNAGGTDGTISKAALEALTVEFCSGTLNPAIADNFRYPFTHIYDSGYSLASKEGLLNILALRDDVKVELSTQDIANPANSQAQDQSTGSSLRAAALLFPESDLYSTQTVRVSIYQQCGLLNLDVATSTYRGIVPATLDRMIKRCIYDGGTFIKGSPKGRPNSEVTIFNPKSINWTPSSDDQKSISWSTGLNYMQYCDTNILFYADLRSVYPIDSSILSSDTFVDRAAIYTKRIVRQDWTIFAGREDPAPRLWNQISKKIDKDINAAFSGNPSSSTTIFQTAQDIASGSSISVQVAMQGPEPDRTWNVTIPVSFTPVSSGSN
jgi:hypothetical protein